MNVETYLTHWEKNKVWTHYAWPKHKKRFQVIASMLEGKSCIDVGCVFGHSTRILSRYYKAQWAGLDFSQVAINKARTLFPSIEFIHADGHNLLSACGDRQFDSVVCSEVIEHIEDDKSFVKEIMKIKKIKLILTTPNRFVNDPGHLRIYDEDMIRDLLKDYSFTIKSVAAFFYIEVR